MPRIRRPEPAHEQIARYYRERIEQGKMRPGQRFPSIPRVAEEWGTSRQTAHNAMKLLQQSGYIVSDPGRGTFVAVPPGWSINKGCLTAR